MSVMQVKIVYSYYLTERVTSIYSWSRKTVNIRESFWNVNYFAINQMQDETVKDKCQTPACLVMTWHETTSWASLPWEPFRRLILIYNLDLHDWHGLQTVRHVNVLKSVTKDSMQHFQNLCFMCRNIQAELSKLDFLNVNRFN